MTRGWVDEGGDGDGDVYCIMINNSKYKWLTFIFCKNVSVQCEHMHKKIYTNIDVLCADFYDML